MDVKMPGKDGIEACKEIKGVSPSTHIIMLTSFDDDEFIYKSIIVGASGYVLKEIGSRELIHAIDTVAEGKSLLDPTVTARIMQHIRQPVKVEKLEILTGQEKEILLLISKGLTNRQIATQIMLGEKTVRNYVSVILSKIEVNNRAEAAAYYVRHQDVM
jgi:two-component system response regulator DevR